MKVYGMVLDLTILKEYQLWISFSWWEAGGVCTQCARLRVVGGLVDQQDYCWFIGGFLFIGHGQDRLCLIFRNLCGRNTLQALMMTSSRRIEFYFILGIFRVQPVELCLKDSIDTMWDDMMQDKTIQEHNGGEALNWKQL